MLYTRPQLILLLSVLGAAGAGLAIGQWRAGHPDLVERLEQLDREPPVTADGHAVGSTNRPSASPAHERARATSPTERRARPAKLTAPPVEAPPPGPLDLNQAGADELSRLPGVGPGLAQRIVAAREADGRFASVDDLRRVRGLGRARLKRLRSLVTIAE
jgi:competence ComEA-like helix-hairpin-helix protein